LDVPLTFPLRVKVSVSAVTDGRWELGLSSELDGVPPGTTHGVIISASNVGIRAAVAEWGGKMQKYHGTRRRHDQGVLSRLLGQWTDNGAGYENGATLADLVEAQTQWRKQKVPIRYVQLDDWWYSGCSWLDANGTSCSGMWVRCVQDWDMLPQFSPRGLHGLQEALDIPFSLYAMYWCRQNQWSESGVRFYNGSDPLHAVALPDPVDARRLFDNMFDFGLSVGMIAYEQDGLDVGLMSVSRYRTDIGSSRSWLASMNAAAAARNISMQCVSTSPPRCSGVNEATATGTDVAFNSHVQYCATLVYFWM
jgi:hypothetical protein